MKPIIISNTLIGKLLPLIGAGGIALYPFIFLIPTHNNPIVRNHEAIHIRQQAEEFVLFFYLRYLYFWIRGRLAGLSWNDAYRAIPYEIEAYSNEQNLNYLLHRPKMAWRSYSFSLK